MLYSAPFRFGDGYGMGDYLGVFVYLLLIIAFAVVSLAAARLLRPSRRYGSKHDTYECGAEAIGDAWVQFPVGFYLVALLFILFDTLAVFLFPWALSLRGLGVWGLAVMFGFVAILGLGWLYARREGVLECK
jgi:NADH:ubiquinone oxidoreductase subunit 3 (subunit A)